MINDDGNSLHVCSVALLHDERQHLITQLPNTSANKCVTVQQKCTMFTLIAGKLLIKQLQSESQCETTSIIEVAITTDDKLRSLMLITIAFVRDYVKLNYIKIAFLYIQ